MPLSRRIYSVLAVLLMVFGVDNVMATEEAKYSVVLKDHEFEVRAYEPHILAETMVEGKFSNAGNKAFRRLFKYITGNNQAQQKVQMTAPVSQAAKSEKIAMTAPVSQQQSDGKWAVSFMMPASSTLETLPQPNDPQVVLRQVPARHMAVVRYSGLWRKGNYQRHSDALFAWIGKQGLTVTGEPVWARYNPPFTPWFLRRNEILVPINATSKK